MKKEDEKETLSRELLKVFKKDDAYRQFTLSQDLSKQIGEQVAGVRKRKKMSTRELAEKIGRSEKEILRMERGEFKKYTIDLLLKIAEATGCSIEVKLV